MRASTVRCRFLDRCGDSRLQLRRNGGGSHAYMHVFMSLTSVWHGSHEQEMHRAVDVPASDSIVHGSAIVKP